MRKTVVTALTATTLLFGGAGVAHATETAAPAPTAPVSTTLAADEDNGGSDDNGLWGLAGLLGLIGLVGLKRRNDHTVAARPAQPGPGTTAR
jgi:hypothetical protein